MTKTRSEKLRDEINKYMGGDVIQLASDPRYEVTYLPSGELPFDIGLQGGLPRGRFVVLTGAFSTLKSYIGLKAIATTQAAGGTCAIIDTEHAFDPKWARELGVETWKLVILRPETGELAIDAADLLVREGVDLIVFDSVAATLPQQEAGRRLHKENVPPGSQARLMSAACRKLTAANSKTSILWINQLREQIGILFGPTERGPGGRALPFYASIIVNIRKAGKLTREAKTFTGDKYASTKEEIGQTFRLLVEKSKLNAPFREVFFDFRLEDPVGIDRVKFLFAQGVEHGIITKRGNTWSYGDAISVGGREKFLERLRGLPPLLERLEDEIREHHGLPILPRGKPARSKAKASATRKLSSPTTEPKRTPAQARGESNTTGPVKRTLSRSRKPR